jgi:protein-disulfide isomerase
MDSPDGAGGNSDPETASTAGSPASTAESPASTADTSSGAVSLPDHPIATELAAQPRYGGLDGHLIVAFEDPSCPRCGAFHSQVVPEVRDKLVEPGKAAFVFRNYPVVYAWGGPATQALEATFARDESAFWGLLDYYYRNQSRLSVDNVSRLTESFLAGTGVDETAVVADAENKAYDDAVQTDLDAAEAGGVGRTTPAVALFRDGEFVTTANGSVSYDLIANTLGEA